MAAPGCNYKLKPTALAGLKSNKELATVRSQLTPFVTWHIQEGYPACNILDN